MNYQKNNSEEDIKRHEHGQHTKKDIDIKRKTKGGKKIVKRKGGP